MTKHNHLSGAPRNAGLCLLSLDDGQVGVGAASAFLLQLPAPATSALLGLQ